MPPLTETARAMAESTRGPARELADSYSAKHLSVLEGLDAVRKRPGMYIGSTDGRGLQHCLWEIFDNAVDEALAGYCTRVEVILHADGSAEVRDNGRGIPVDNERKTKLSGVELVMTRLHAGGKFGGGSYTASGGLHGVGASVVNALSARLDIEVDRDGHTWATSFRRGVAGEFAEPGAPAGRRLQPGRRGCARSRGSARPRTGTRIRFWPDRQVFLRDATFSYDGLAERARQTAYLVPGLAIAVRAEAGAQPGPEADGDGDGGGPRQAEFRFAGGISEFCEHLAAGEKVTDVLRLTGDGTFTETVPVLDDRGHMTPTEVERTLDVDMAVQWNTGYDTITRSFVNVIATPHHGTHVTGFDRALAAHPQRAAASRQAPAERRRAGHQGGHPRGPHRASSPCGCQSRSSRARPRRSSAPPRPPRSSARSSARSSRTTSRTRRAARSSRPGRSWTRSRARPRPAIAAREHRENQRRKSALASSSLPAKLVDCRSADDRSELFIVEGDSALGTAKLARDSEFQALLPIRGKILNVQKSSLADMLKNAECAAIIQVLGAGSGSTFDLDSARYQRVILMADADVDGAHIRTLLLTLFHRYMRPMLEAGRVFAAVPPLHRIELTNPRKGQLKYIGTPTPTPSCAAR